MTQQSYEKTKSENIILGGERYFSVMEYQPVQKYKNGRYILYRHCIFLFINYIFNSNIGIYIVVETSTKSVLLSSFCLSEKHRSLYLHTQTSPLCPTKNHSDFFILQ